MVYDVAVIGAGVVGATIAYELSAYNLKVCVLEKNLEPVDETSSANSGIVHAGYDAEPGTLKARLNVEGNALMEQLCKDLSVKFKRIGSVVVAVNEIQAENIKVLYDWGIKNGVPDIRIIDREELFEMEPNVSEDSICALYAPSAGIVCPYKLALSALDTACENGVELIRDFEVTGLARSDEGFKLTSSSGEQVQCKYIVNAAGLYSDDIANLAGDTSFTIRPRKGEYVLFEKDMGEHVNMIVFPTPQDGTKGILTVPTVDGNLFIGPNANYIEDKSDVATTTEGIDEIWRGANSVVKGISSRGAITSFSGLRATSPSSNGDFIINEAVPKFINVAGIDSPGLSASPAIAKYVLELLVKSGLEQKANTNASRKYNYTPMFRDMSLTEQNDAIKEAAGYGKIICRCEVVTEEDIRSAIRKPAGARTLDGIKRWTRAGMGRCQSGFCGSRVVDILAEELKIPVTEVMKSGKGSYVLCGKTR